MPESQAKCGIFRPLLDSRIRSRENGDKNVMTTSREGQGHSFIAMDTFKMCHPSYESVSSSISTSLLVMLFRLLVPTIRKSLSCLR
jgi:hypothetical protein